MARLSPEEAAQKWAQRASAASEDYRRGVQRVNVSPGQQAAAKRTKWEQGINNSKDKWEQRVRSVSLSDWQAATAGEGANRFASGVTAKQEKMARFTQEFFPHLERGQARVKSMPDTSFEDRINRMVEMARHNRNFRRGGPSAGV